MTTKDILIQFEEKFHRNIADGAEKDMLNFLSTSISKLLDEVVEACEKNKKQPVTKMVHLKDKISSTNRKKSRMKTEQFNLGLSTAIEIVNSKR